MKTQTISLNPSKSSRLRLVSAAAAMAAAAVASAATSADNPSDPKPYTLFMGADVAVGQNARNYPILDVTGGAWVVRIDGRQVTLSAKDQRVQMRITPGLKLTEISASIADLKAMPSYSSGNDPYSRFTQQTDQAASDMAQAQFAQDEAFNLLISDVVMYGHQIQGHPGAPGLMVGGDYSDIFGASGAGLNLNNASRAIASAYVASGASPGMAVGANTVFDTEGFDAMDVSFEVSAKEPLDHPYVVLIGRYRDRGNPAGEYRNWIVGEALEPINSKLAKVLVQRGGLPRGFEMKDIQVHLYNDGQEVATNVASNRVTLTRDEAFEYVKMDYLSSHKGATLPAVPALGRLPADLPSRLAQGQFSHGLYVRVSKDGVGEEAYDDEACSHRVEDPYVVTVLKDIRFEPALENGKPVDGVAKLNLGKLAM